MELKNENVKRQSAKCEQGRKKRVKGVQ